jgi:hypothetical protein
LLLLATTFVAGAGLAVAIVALDSYLDPFDDGPFTPEAWAVADDEERAAMARGAVKHVSVGMPETEVVALLGKPDWIWNSRELTASAPARAVRTYSYGVATSSLASLRRLDSVYVWVHVGGDGRVIVAEIGGG